MNNDPDWDPNLFAGKRRLYYGRWDYKYESAARQGAAGAIIIHTTPSAGYPWQVVQSSWGGEQFQLPAGSEPRLKVKAWATEDAVKRLLKAGGFDLDKLVAAAHSRDFKPVPLGITTSLTFSNELSQGPDRERRRGAARQRSQARRPGGGAVGAPRSLRHRRTGRHGRPHLPRRRGQRLRLRAGAGDRARLRGAAAAAAALDHRAVRGRRGARPARLAVLRRASERARRPDRGEHQHRWRQHLRPHPRCDADQHGQELAGCGRRAGGQVAGSRAQGRPVPRPRLLLPLRPVLVRQDRRAGAVSSTVAPTSSGARPAGAGSRSRSGS